ncbi:MAG: HAD hydrolase-like protein [Mogibacterium sp.]|nr:HAD hydrolase-like protein [Mogibacterium sp.]
MKYKYYLFDLDGTLTDPGIGITNSVMYALEKFGIHVSNREELYPFIGPPLTDSFIKYFDFSEKQALQAVEYYREYFRADGIFENKVYDGIPEMLGELKARNAITALATSKPYEFSVRILEHFGLRQYFDYVGAATMDGRISKKADVIRHLLGELGDADTGSVLMIGDRDQDIEGAKANGLHCAGVLWGYGSNDELMGAGADYIVSAPSDILSL